VILHENDILSTIRNINEDIEMYIGSDLSEDIFILDYISNEYDSVIEYLGVRIWSSVDDERKHMDSDLRESLDSYLRRRMKKMHKVIEEVEV
jgi:hypothetical protein